MFLSTLSVSLLTATAFAQFAQQAHQPNPDTIPQYDETFSIVARGLPHFDDVEIRAQGGHFYLGGPQHARCDKHGREESATFIRKHDNSMYLYTSRDPMQQTWVDKTGLAGFSDGQGKGPQTASYGPWQLDKTTGQIKFDGKTPFACPVKGVGKFNLWFFEAGKARKRCSEITLLGVKSTGRPRCDYTTKEEGEGE